MAEPPPDPDLANRNQEDFDRVKSGVGFHDSATASGKATASTEQSSENTDKNTAQTRELTDVARQAMDNIDAGKRQADAQMADRQQQYSVPTTQDIMGQKLAQLEAEGKAVDPSTRAGKREMRRLKREAAKEYEVTKDKIYNMLDPNRASDKEYRRRQNIKAIIAGIGDLGRMAGQAVTAANSGIILPFKSLTDGVVEDKKISDRERAALERAIEQMRQGKLNEPFQRLQDLEKQKLALLKSNASYDTRTSESGSRNTNASRRGTESGVSQTKEKLPYFRPEKPEKDTWQNRVRSGAPKNGGFIWGGFDNQGNLAYSGEIDQAAAVDLLNTSLQNFKKIPLSNVEIEDEKGRTVKPYNVLYTEIHDLMANVGKTDERSKFDFTNKALQVLRNMNNQMRKMMADPQATEADKEAVQEAFDSNLSEFKRLTRGHYLPYDEIDTNDDSPAGHSSYVPPEDAGLGKLRI